MEKYLYYFLFFLIGILTGWFYFSHLWKSIIEYKTNKFKIILSSFFRFPVPIIAVFIAGFVLGIGGIIAVIFGFTVFQFVYLIQKGSKLKKEIEEFAKNYNNLEEKKVDGE